MCVKEARNEAHPRVKFLRMGRALLPYPKSPYQLRRQPLGLTY